MQKTVQVFITATMGYHSQEVLSPVDSPTTICSFYIYAVWLHHLKVVQIYAVGLQWSSIDFEWGHHGAGITSPFDLVIPISFDLLLKIFFCLSLFKNCSTFFLADFPHWGPIFLVLLSINKNCHHWDSLCQVVSSELMHVSPMSSLTWCVPEKSEKVKN